MFVKSVMYKFITRRIIMCVFLFVWVIYNII